MPGPFFTPSHMVVGHSRAVCAALFRHTPTIHAHLKALLVRDGYQARYASNGLAALEILATAPADLVLTDVMMPIIGGSELLQANA